MSGPSPPCSLQEGDIHVALTPDRLDVAAAVASVKRAHAGAVVLFAGIDTPSGISPSDPKTKARRATAATASP